LPRFSQSNEETALNDALDRCKQAVAGFAGSLQSDLGTLADADPGTPRYNLATVRPTRRPVPVALAPTAAALALATTPPPSPSPSPSRLSLCAAPIHAGALLGAARAGGGVALVRGAA
jgi:hypothetical protein